MPINFNTFEFRMSVFHDSKFVNKGYQKFGFLSRIQLDMAGLFPLPGLMTAV